MAALLAALPLLAAATTPGAWIDKEFMTPIAVSIPAIEAFINHDCGPAGLDGIQIFAVQSGHADNPHVHVYCRTDHSRRSHYAVTLPTFAKGAFDPVVLAATANGHTRVGPFVFGAPGSQDGLILISRER
jgi:hypothetical protein